MDRRSRSRSRRASTRRRSWWRSRAAASCRTCCVSSSSRVRNVLGSAAIKQHAAALGFDLCGIAPAAAFPELGFLSDWIARGYAGEMDYLEKSASVRADIRHFLPSARSVIVMGTVYNTEPGTGNREPGAASDAIKIARYARRRDYPKVIEDPLLELI